MVIFRSIAEDLSLVLKPPESKRMKDPRIVSAKFASDVILLQIDLVLKVEDIFIMFVPDLSMSHS